MQQLTIKISDNYAKKLYSLLELFPKNALKIEAVDEKKSKELEKHTKAIRKSLEDIKIGKTTKRREVCLNI